jgi:geranylgeranyl reductase family protein
VTSRHSPDRTDVLVVGAGPAGCAAAIELIRAGRSVIVVDKATFPRDKCCGDGLTADALRVLDDLGLRPDQVPNWNTVTDVIVRSPRGRELVLPLPDGPGHYAAVVPRIDLDNELFHLARNAGADMREAAGLESIRELDDRVVVALSDGTTVEARYVVAADGMWSPTRKALGLEVDGYRGEWHAYRQYFSNTSGPRSQHLVVWFEPDLLPGYAWSFPLPGQRVNVGFGIVRGGAHRVGDMGRLWTDLLARNHVRDVLGPGATAEDSPKAWPIPARLQGLPTHHGRVLFAGDAIGATDPMTGEGIAQALRSGQIAARALIAAGPHRPDIAGARHGADLDSEIGRDHRFARRLQGPLESVETTEWLLRLVDLNAWTRRNFARWMFEDYPRAVALTPDRWERTIFDRPGAFRRLAPPFPAHADAAGRIGVRS